VGTLNWSFVLGKMVESIEKNRRFEKVLIGVPLSLMCTFSLKFGQSSVTLGFLVFEEGNFCLTSILVVVAMTEKMIYKKRTKVAVRQTTNYSPGGNSDTFCLLVTSKNQKI
jgi:hypothetical protein